MMIAELTDTTFHVLANKYRTIVALVNADALDCDADEPILVGSDGDLLDGFHRVSGYVAALDEDPSLADDDIRVVVVHNDDVAALCAEPGGAQKEAIALAYAVAGVEV